MVNMWRLVSKVFIVQNYVDCSIKMVNKYIMGNNSNAKAQNFVINVVFGFYGALDN